MQVRLDTSSDLTFGLVLLRSAAAGAHERRETGLLRLAAPGIAGAVRIAAALGALQDKVVLDTAELLYRPAILIDRDRGIVSLSAGAEQVLRAGRFLTVASNRLLATRPDGNLALDRAIGAATAVLPHERRSSCIALANTVRPQLKAIFEKTRTRRQTELALLVRQLGGS